MKILKDGGVHVKDEDDIDTDNFKTLYIALKCLLMVLLV